MDSMAERIPDLFSVLPVWPFGTPRLYGPFHIAASLVSILIPWLLVFRGKKLSRSASERRLFRCGWIFLFLETYKQLFLFFAVNDMHYDFWFFPFQLCSAAMYLCLALPFLSERAKDTVFTFLFDFSLPGALLALCLPADMLRSSISLTLHAFLWHAILVYCGLLVFRNRLVKADLSGYRSAAVLYLLLAFAAVVLNVLFDPLAVYGNRPNLFYLSPLQESPQPVFHEISVRFGVLPEMLLYVLSYLLFCFLFHLLCTRAYKRESN